MARRGFYSFCFDDDQWRASKVRQMGVIEGDRALGDNDWEKLRNQGDDAVKRWIDKQMVGKSVVVVLIGARTAGRKFVQYEISRGWDNGMGVFGIYVHNLLDRDLKQSAQGRNPFEKAGLSNIVKAYNPPYSISKNVYGNISESLSDWAEETINIRKKYV